MDTVRAVGDTFLSRSTRLGGVGKAASGSSDSDGGAGERGDRKRGRKTTLDNLMALRAAAKAERDADRAELQSAKHGSNDFMQMYLLMQRDREEREEKREREEREERRVARATEMQFMAMMAQFMAPALAAARSLAPAAVAPAADAPVLAQHSTDTL